VRPLLDFGAKPEHAPSAAKVHHGARHVGITVPVDADVIRVREAEDRRDAASIDQVFGGDDGCHVGERISQFGSVRQAI